MRRREPTQPTVRIGHMADNGVGASIYGLLDRGAMLRPHLAATMRGTVEVRYAEDLAPVCIRFNGDLILVEDGSCSGPDLLVSGRLPDIVHLMGTPMAAGIPNPITRRGRAALGRIARRQVQLVGDRSLARQLLRLLALTPVRHSPRRQTRGALAPGPQRPGR